MKPQVWMLIVGLGLRSVSAAAESGVGSRGGGDNPFAEHGSAWFLGEGRAIRYCLEIGANFGVDRLQAERVIEDGFDTWFRYIARADIQPQLRPESRLATRISRLSRCDGTEDLKFYFGVSNAATEAAKKAYDNPTAFAVRTAYDPQTAWGKGFVWFAAQGTVNLPNREAGSFPKWTSPHALTAMMLHEIGHIYGCEHMEGTIMTDSINRIIDDVMSYDEAAYPKKRLQIDQERELVRNMGSDSVVYAVSTLDKSPISYSSFRLPDIFRILVGRPAQGEVRLSISKGGPARGLLQPEWEEFTLRDDAGKVSIPLPRSREGSLLVFTGERMFKTAAPLVRREGYFPSLYAIGQSTAQTIRITSADGKSYWAEFSWNASLGNSGPVAFRLLADQSYFITLNQADPVRSRGP